MKDPVPVYDAANDAEAHLVSNLLTDAGVEAYVTEDAQVGQLPKPQVWVDRSDLDRAKPLLEDYERRQQRELVADAGDATVKASCEECGTTSTFPAAQDGTVQVCPNCGAYMDVGTVSDSEELGCDADSDESAEGEA